MSDRCDGCVASCGEIERKEPAGELTAETCRILADVIEGNREKIFARQKEIERLHRKLWGRARAQRTAAVLEKEIAELQAKNAELRKVLRTPPVQG